LFREDAIFGEFLASSGGCRISSALDKRKNLHGMENYVAEIERFPRKYSAWKLCKNLHGMKKDGSEIERFLIKYSAWKLCRCILRYLKVQGESKLYETNLRELNEDLDWFESSEE
jgi:hypothetical protein